MMSEGVFAERALCAGAGHRETNEANLGPISCRRQPD
jgi:hypothetical protein